MACSIQNIVGIYKQITLLIIYQISSKLVTILKVIYHQFCPLNFPLFWKFYSFLVLHCPDYLHLSELFLQPLQFSLFPGKSYHVHESTAEAKHILWEYY